MPPPHCPPNPAAAIAAAAMPKRKKQNQPQPPQHLELSERDEPGDEEDERPMGQSAAFCELLPRGKERRKKL